MSCPVCGKTPHDYRCPNANPPKIHGYCPVCYKALRDDYTYYVDNDSNIFCSEECAIKFHGIIETDWEDENE